MLLDRGADPNTQISDSYSEIIYRGWRALNFATYNYFVNGNPQKIADIVKQLVDKNAIFGGKIYLKEKSEFHAQRNDYINTLIPLSNDCSLTIDYIDYIDQNKAKFKIRRKPFLKEIVLVKNKPTQIEINSQTIVFTLKSCSNNSSTFTAKLLDKKD